MHLVCLGVVLRLLELWAFTMCLSGRQVKAISERLINLKDFVPVEFARKAKGLEERLKWKATKKRQCLQYTRPVVRVCLAEQVYNNFMLLSAAICILANPSLFINE